MIELKKAWLITWEWDAEYAAMKDKVVGIYKSSWGTPRIKMLMDFIFHQSNSNLSELSSYVRYPSTMTYRSESDSNGWLVCGKSTNPYLYGRIVSEICIKENNEGFEEVVWYEPERFEITDGGIVKIMEKFKQGYVRKYSGQLSTERMIKQ